GLENAISLQGGIEYLSNLNIGASKDLSIEVNYETDFKITRGLDETQKSRFGLNILEVNYGFALRFKKSGSGYEISEDRLSINCDFLKLNKVKQEYKGEKIGSGEIVVYQSNGQLKVEFPENLPVNEAELFPPFYKGMDLSDTLILESPVFFMLVPPPVNYCANIAIYDIDPRISKEAARITGKAVLEEDGSNLSIVLKNLIGDQEKRRKLFNLVKDVLPFIDDLSVEKFAGTKSLLLKLRETYNENEYLPASLISEGTVNITTLIIALYFEKQLLAVIEEPERSIHPYLISRLVDMMKDASHRKQIIATTHNPQVVKHAELDNILLMSRDEKGFSKITKPTDMEHVKTFLDNEIGIEELYVRDLLAF
ncbi:MAG: AAA family ATPase, partial [Promethearchaeota archaeon]